MLGRSAFIALTIVCILKDPVEGTVIRGCKLYEEMSCGPNAYCFDDGGSGACVEYRDEVTPEEVILKRLLEEQRLEEVAKSLSREGYTSSDPYWNCVMANVMRHYDYPSRKDCSEYAKVTDDKRTEDNNEELPRDVASINYAPSSRDSHSQYADELYSPLFLGQLGGEDLPNRNRERVSNPSWRDRSEEEERHLQRESPVQLIRELEKEVERERQEEVERSVNNAARVIAVKKSAPTPHLNEYWIPYGHTDKMRLLQNVIRDETERERAAVAAAALQDEDEEVPSPHEEFQPPYTDFSRLLSNIEPPHAGFPLSVAADNAESLGPVGRFSDNPVEFPTEYLRVYNSPELFRQGFESRDAIPQPTFRKNVEPEDFDRGDESVGLSERVYADTPKPIPDITGFSRDYNTPDGFRAGLETRDDINVPYDRLSFLQGQDDSPDDQAVRQQGLEFLASLLSDAEWSEQERPDKQFVPQQVQKKKKSQHDLERAEVSQLMRAAEEEAKEIPEEILAEEQAVEGAPGRAYTEGGLVLLQDQETPHESGDPSGEEIRLNPSLDDGLSALLALGFKRRERLDVKKPGPPFLTNSYAYGDVAAAAAAASEPERPEKDPLNNRAVRAQIQRGEPIAQAQKAGPNFSAGANYDRFGVVPEQKNAYTVPPNGMPLHRNNQKKTSSGPEDLSGSGTAASAGTGIVSDFDIGAFPTEDDQTVDDSVVTVTFKEKITSWVEGERIIVYLANAVNVYAGSFTKRRVYPYQVSFKVDEQQAHMNASEVVQQIMNNKDLLQRNMQRTIESADVGEKAGDVESHPIFSDMFNKLSVTVLVAVIALAVILSAVTIHSIRTYRRRIDKLCGLAQQDTEASKDYQDLCRARMSKKTEHEKPEPLHVDQRVASLSRESEGSNTSPSNRSSTSSWSEEPAISNMDISTGHMVLAYMEDHLKNKDRLEQEWRALCAYEAEPCETTVANLPQNMQKNRYYPHVLPYDHSRVVLSERANVSNSDYINASTITDHDPRNPVYLATQGPLEHTIPDFWQLVWEQGSVVMVMLTRLTENGTSMCQRYWPEEGSELYHIYEVHLVSEHIWCDDYLVRSFYLKNLMTSETRTVTQFHFLSWPEHGVPAATKPLLDFRRKVNKSYRGRSCPIVVHCSDGAGRTGTYCLIDMVLNRMAKGAKEIDIAATLEHIRDQRPSMVESREQFEFCLAAVADEVHAILKALPSQPTPLPATTAATTATSSTTTTTASAKPDQEKKEKK